MHPTHNNSGLQFRSIIHNMTRYHFCLIKLSILNMMINLSLSCSNPFPCTYLLNILQTIIRIYKLSNILFHLQYLMAFACIAVIAIHVQCMFKLLQIAVFHLFILVNQIIVFWMLPYILSTYTIFLHLDEKLLMS